MTFMEITASFDVDREVSAVFESLNDLEKVGLCISGVKEVKAISAKVGNHPQPFTPEEVLQAPEK